MYIYLVKVRENEHEFTANLREIKVPLGRNKSGGTQRFTPERWLQSKTMFFESLGFQILVVPQLILAGPS